MNLVWQATSDITLHAGYSRYFSPPPFELVGSQTLAKFEGTTAAPPVGQATTPSAERAHYFDVGMSRKMSPALSIGIDTYYKKSANLIDEGQFGAPIILTPFTYAQGRQYGAELTANYAAEGIGAYLNLAAQSATGKNIDSSQFNFTQADLDYIAQHFIHLDHEQKITASGGASYHWNDTRMSVDFLLGSGLRSSPMLADGLVVPNGSHLPVYFQVNLGFAHELKFDSAGSMTVRLDVINATDRIYEIRDGTGVGVGAPQFGPRRGVFVGVTKSI